MDEEQKKKILSDLGKMRYAAKLKKHGKEGVSEQNRKAAQARWSKNRAEKKDK